MATESGFNNSKVTQDAHYKTIHNLGSDRFGAPVTSKTLFEVSSIPAAIAAVSQSADGKEIYIDYGAAHNARVGDVLFFETGALAGWEFEITEILDSDSLTVLNIAPSLPVVGNTTLILRWVTPRSDSSGNMQFSPGPTTFEKDGVTTVVSLDTAVPGNSEGIPTRVLNPDGSQADFGALASIQQRAKARLDVTPVLDSAYTELIADVGATAIKKVRFFTSTGDAFFIGIGAAGVEVEQEFYITPGLNDTVDLAIPANSRVAVKRVDAPGADTSGFIYANFLG